MLVFVTRKVLTWMFKLDNLYLLERYKVLKELYVYFISFEHLVQRGAVFNITPICDKVFAVIEALWLHAILINKQILVMHS